MNQNLQDKYNALSPGGVPADPSLMQQPVADPNAAPQGGAETLTIAANDLATIRELKAKGNEKAIGAFIASLV